MNTDLVLINPQVVPRSIDLYPPLSLLCLAAYVRTSGYSVTFIDAKAENLSDLQLKEKVIALHPLLVGITFMTNQFGIVKQLVALLKEGTNFKLVAGGIHASSLPQETKEMGFDYVVVGEGEQTLVELLDALKNGVVGDIDGLWGNNKYFQPRKVIENLDSLPLPAWDLAPISKYEVDKPAPRYSLKAGECLGVYTSRGCLYNCTFCNSHGVYGHTHRDRSPKNIVDELEWLVSLGVHDFWLVDESILGNSKRAEQFAEEILQRGLKIAFASSARVTDEGVNLKTLKKLNEAGMKHVDLGVESGSVRILKDLCKGITIEAITRAHQIAHQAGLTTYSFMIAGHLEENWDDIYNSLELIGKIDTDFCGFAPLTPYPGTQVFEQAKAEGWIRNSDWSMFYITNPYRVMRSRYFDYQELCWLSLLCTDYARCMIQYKKIKPQSIRDFQKVLKSTWMGSKPIGRYRIVQYMMTKDRNYLSSLNFKMLKLKPEKYDTSLPAGIRRNPLIFFKKPEKLKLVRMLVPLLWNRIREGSAARVMEWVYAVKLSSFYRRTQQNYESTVMIDRSNQHNSDRARSARASRK